MYSIGYMHRDPGFDRFFVYLNLFLFSMVVLVLADNFLFSFLGWEGVGFCSYGLVGFWFQREVAAVAAKKAFVTNRVGDVGLPSRHVLDVRPLQLARTIRQSWAPSSRAMQQASCAGTPGAIDGTTATAITLLLFLGAVGKSAQIPLYIWLPDAMEGPTPISALIHAATMVTAGVYLMARVAPMLHYAHATSWVVACIGAGTAFLAATIACAQDDIKKALAYSTVSQLGYMFLAIGAGDYVDGIFHMLTHAFFKALLFLAAGAVIHAMANRQDMKQMGGLRQVPAPHGADLCRRLAGHLGDTTVGRFLVQGRDPVIGVGDEQGALGDRARHGWPDGLLHEPPVRSRVHGPGALERGPAGRGS